MKDKRLFNEILKDLRLKNNLSQKQLAKDLGFSQSAIAKWELGLQIPNIIILTKLVIYFKVTADYILGLKN